MRLGESKKQPDRFHWQHLLAWLGGMLCALVPFVGYWELGTMKVPVHNGPGYFGWNIVIVSGLCLLGGLVGGYWWRFCKWMLGDKDRPLTVASCLLFGLGVFGWVITGARGWESADDRGWYLFQVGAVLLIGVVLAFVWRTGHRRRLGMVSTWMREKRKCNVLFFGLLFVFFAVCNVILVLGMEIGTAQKASVLFGRMCSSLVLVGGLYLLSELTVRAAPKNLRWAPWLLISFVPVAVAADQWMRMALGRRLTEFVNGLTSSGEFKPLVELEAGTGVDMGIVGLIVLVVVVFGGSYALAWGCWKFSTHRRLDMSIGRALTVTLLSWLCVVAEQGASAHWKSTAAWQMERKVFSVHLGIFSPPEGLGKYEIVFYEPGDGSLPSGELTLANKPDIYVFMVESMREDVLREDATPYLWWMKNEECQPIGSGWAGSNATHLSWFNFFHSQVPVFWRSELELVDGDESFAGAAPLQLLKKAGYDIQVRAVCDLSYKKFGFLNFGAGNNLASVMVDDGEDSVHFEGMDIPQREVKVFGELREAVQQGSQGGRFFFTALDSPHYNYYWHEDFEPPFKGYAEDISFPFNPDAQEVRRYLRRYWNSCAWIDHQIEGFCEFLKKEGRYDNSIIIVTGDHGEEFQERGGWCHCSSLQPEQTQVPLLIKWPKSMGRGPAKKAASHADVMPTLLAALGIPVSSQPKMVGANLLRQGQQLTVISTTAYAGKDGEAMIWRNGDYEAVFSWPRYWDASVPEVVVLERLTGPDGELQRADAGEYLHALREIFPDAFERMVESLDVITK